MCGGERGSCLACCGWQNLSAACVFCALFPCCPLCSTYLQGRVQHRVGKVPASSSHPADEITLNFWILLLCPWACPLRKSGCFFIHVGGQKHGLGQGVQQQEQELMLCLWELACSCPWASRAQPAVLVGAILLVCTLALGRTCWALSRSELIPAFWVMLACWNKPSFDLVDRSPQQLLCSR